MVTVDEILILKYCQKRFQVQLFKVNISIYISIPPENMRKPYIFLMFSGGLEMEPNGTKWIKLYLTNATLNLSALKRESYKYIRVSQMTNIL